MPVLRVHDLLPEKILVSRESARLLAEPLRAMLATAKTRTATVDFAGAEGVAPSFLDELLSIFESLVGEETAGAPRSLIVAHPPTRLSLKFEAIARGHGMSVQAMPDGSWVLTDARRT